MAEPIITRLPQSITSFQNRYGQGSPYSSLPAPVFNALRNLDAERAMRGQSPMTETAGLLGGLSAARNQAITPEKDQNILGDFLSDANLLLRSVPKLPAAMIEELKALPQAGDTIARANEMGGNPLGNMAMAPGFRLIPGAYIAGNVLGGVDPETGQEGSPGELLEHPLFTALDALPLASGAAARTAVGRAARAATFETGARFRPIRSLATRKLDEAGQLVPNKFSERVLTPSGGALRRTRPGQFLSEAFGDMGRGPARAQSKQSDWAHRVMSGVEDFPDDPGLFRDINDFGKKLADDEVDFDKFTTDIQRKSPHELTDVEAARVHEYRGLTDRLLKIGEDENKLRQVVIGGTKEVYDYRTARHLTELSRRTQTAEQMVAAREAIFNPEGINPDRVLDDLSTFFVDTAANRTIDQTRQLLRAKLTVLNNTQFDVSDILRDVRNMTRGTVDQVSSRVQELVDNPGAYMVGDTRGAVDELVRQVKPLQASNRMVDRVIVATKRGDPIAVSQAIRDIRGKGYMQGTGVGDELIERALSEARQWANNARFNDSTRQFNSAYLNKVKEREGAFIARNPSARFHTKLEDDLQKAMEAAATGKGLDDLAEGVAEQARKINKEVFTSNPNLDGYLDYIRNRSYSMVADLPPAEFSALKTAVKKTWLSMKEAGFDPTFVHRVDEGAARALRYPKILERILEPSQVKARVFDSRPYVNDAQVALTHQAYEWLNRRGSEQFVDDITNMYGVDEAALRERFYPLAQRKAEMRGTPVETELEQLLRREYTPFQPRQFVTWPGARISDKANRVWVPKGVRKNIERMHVPPGERVSGFLDPIMKVFRTSLLPLSPRWHVYNIVGNGVMLMARTDPTAFKFLPQVWRATRDGKLPELIPKELPLGSSLAPMTEWAFDWGKTIKAARGGDKTARQQVMAAGWQVKAGMKMRQLLDKMQPVREGFGNVVQKSYDWNMRIDDMGRAMAYLYNTEKGLTKNLSKEAAQARGIALTKRIFQNWDEITPLERTIMRFVFPFYSWTSHILRYVASYPMDHPVRASVMASFARNEIEDMGTGLPERFMSMFNLGTPDINGKVSAINLSGMNPFEDTANWFSLAGFLAGEDGNLSAVTSNLNPIFSAVLQSIGVDPMKGSAELYPNLDYNPDTGRLEPKGTSPVLNAINAVIPQTRLLTNIATGNDEWKELVRSDPDAAWRLVQSTVGVPAIYRTYNPVEETIKAETNRYEDQNDARRDALKSGDFGGMDAYPGLRAYAAMIRQMDQSGQLDQYRPSQAAGQLGIEEDTGIGARVVRSLTPSG